MRRRDFTEKRKFMRKREKRDQKKKDRGIVDFMRVVFHFFKEIRKWINEIQDPRNKSYIIYQQNELIFMGILKNICSIESMRQMEELFNEENCIEILRLISGNAELSEMPHYDTLNYYLERLSPECLSKLRGQMVKSLIRSKAFNKTRLLGKYWRVIFDGTGLFYFKEKHCEHCLVEKRTNQEGKKELRYYHKVLEAKLVLGEKLIISLGTEFIENEAEDVEKQDCEINAAKRLFKRLKKEYPRLPICLQGDALYAAESIMKVCRVNGWTYIITQKDTRQKLVAESYEFIKAGGEVQKKSKIGRENGKGCYVNGVAQTAGKTEEMNVIEYEYTKTEKGEEKKVIFQWITNIKISERNLEELVEAGRDRWKIENEAFNNQKNGQYRISHINSWNSNAMKNHYLLTQIADIMMQLYLLWTPLVKEMGQSIKNTSSRLLESFRRQPVTEEDVLYILEHTAMYLE